MGKNLRNLPNLETTHPLSNPEICQEICQIWKTQEIRQTLKTTHPLPPVLDRFVPAWVHTLGLAVASCVLAMICFLVEKKTAAQV